MNQKLAPDKWFTLLPSLLGLSFRISLAQCLPPPSQFYHQNEEEGRREGKGRAGVMRTLYPHLSSNNVHCF